MLQELDGLRETWELSVYHMTRWIGNKEVKLMLEIWLKEIYGLWHVYGGSVTGHRCKMTGSFRGSTKCSRPSGSRKTYLSLVFPEWRQHPRCFFFFLSKGACRDTFVVRSKRCTVFVPLRLLLQEVKKPATIRVAEYELLRSHCSKGVNELILIARGKREKK